MKQMGMQSATLQVTEHEFIRGTPVEGVASKGASPMTQNMAEKY